MYAAEVGFQKTITYMGIEQVWPAWNTRGVTWGPTDLDETVHGHGQDSVINTSPRARFRSFPLVLSAGGPDFMIKGRRAATVRRP